MGGIMVSSTTLIALILICSLPLCACENSKTNNAHTLQQEPFDPRKYPAHCWWPDWDWENPETVREEQEALEKIVAERMKCAEQTKCAQPTECTAQTNGAEPTKSAQPPQKLGRAQLSCITAFKMALHTKSIHPLEKK